jgi:hypothetical protein
MESDIDLPEVSDLETIIAELKRISAITGKSRVSVRDISRFGNAQARSAIVKFGALRNANRRWTNNQLLKNMVDMWVNKEKQSGKIAAAEPDSKSSRHVKPPRRDPIAVRTRFHVLKRDLYRCRICGRTGVELEVDHIIPASLGGSDTTDNLQTLCFDCNRGKRDSLQ